MTWNRISHQTSGHWELAYFVASANVFRWKMSSRLRKQTRVWCGHCNEYLSRSTFWKHRQAYYDVKSERWITKDDAGRLHSLGDDEKKARLHDPDDQMHEFRDEPSESSSDEDFEAALSREGM